MRESVTAKNLTFDSFLRSLNAYSKKEIIELENLYSTAQMTTKHSVVVSSFISAAQIALRHSDEGYPIDKLLTSKKDLADLAIPKLAAERGLLVFRSLFAKEITAKRASDNLPYHAIQYYMTGYTVIENFLENSADVDLLTEAIANHPLGVHKTPETTINSSRKPAVGGILREFLWESKLRECVFDCLMLPANHRDASMKFRDNTFVQRVYNAPGSEDIQKVIHMDTYFDALKFWYFPEEVKLENGPFAISPESNILTIERLNWMQKSYMKFYNNEIEPERGSGNTEGSLRVFPNELVDMNLAMKYMAVPENSLVIANVFGFHARGEATVETIRGAIHGSIRVDEPFSE